MEQERPAVEQVYFAVYAVQYAAYAVNKLRALGDEIKKLLSRITFCPYCGSSFVCSRFQAGSGVCGGINESLRV